jgi:hypothetical protein
MFGAIGCGEHRRHGERGRNGGNLHVAGEAALERIDLLSHGAGVGDDTSRPLEQRNHKFKLVDHGFISSSGPPAPIGYRR